MLYKRESGAAVFTVGSRVLYSVTLAAGSELQHVWRASRNGEEEEPGAD